MKYHTTPDDIKDVQNIAEYNKKNFTSFQYQDVGMGLVDDPKTTNATSMLNVRDSPSFTRR